MFVPLRRKPFNKDAIVYPNVPSYNRNYDKYKVQSSPMDVPEYKAAETNRWQQTYNKVKTESHPDFKPIYGPQNKKK